MKNKTTPALLCPICHLEAEYHKNGFSDCEQQPTKTVPPMTRDEWKSLPPIVRFFHPWKRAKKPLTIQDKNAPSNERATSAAAPCNSKSR